MKSRENSFEAEGFVEAQLGLRVDTQSGEESDCGSNDRNRVNRSRSTEKCVEQTTHRGAENCGELKDTGVPRNSVLKVLFDDELGEKGATGRHAEGADRA